MIESECSEAEKESQHSSSRSDSDEDYNQDMEMDQMMDELPDDMPLCQLLPKKDLKRKANDSSIAKKKKNKKAKQYVEIDELPNAEFPKSYVRGAKNSHCLIQNRCCYSGLMNTYLLVKDLLPEEFFACIRSLRFGHFLNDVEVVVNPFNLNDLVGRYIDEHKFAVKDKVLEMTIGDVGHILGLPFSGVTICIDKEDEINY